MGRGPAHLVPVRVIGTQDAEQLDRLDPQIAVLGLGAHHGQQELHQARVLFVRLNDIARVAGELPQRMQSCLALGRRALVLQGVNHQRHERILVGEHLFAADGAQLPECRDDGSSYGSRWVSCLGQKHLRDGVDIWLHEVLGMLRQQTEKLRALLLAPRHVRVLQLGQQLDDGLAKLRNHVSRVIPSQTTNDGHCDFANDKMLVVECKEQSPDVLGLGEMLVEPLVQGRQHGAPDLRFRVRDPDGEEPLDHIGDDLQGVLAGLVDDGILHVQLATGQCSGFSNFGIVVLDVFDGDVADKLVQNVASSLVSTFVLLVEVVGARG